MDINNVVQERIAAIETCIARLSEIRKSSKKEFLADWRLQDSALRNFQVAIEAAIDISNHLIAEREWRTPKSAAESIDILAEHKVLPKAFAETLKKIVSFRNLIVHFYGDIDLAKIYDYLSQTDELKRFLGYVVTV